MTEEQKQPEGEATAPEATGAAAPVATPSDQGDGAGARTDPAADPSGTPAEAGAVTDPPASTDADATLESPAAPASDAGAGDGWSTGATEGDGSTDATTPVDPATAAEAADPADAVAPDVGASVTPSTAADVSAGGEAPPDAAVPPADPAAGAAAAPAGALSSDRIQLVGESGQALTLGVRTPLGKHAVRQFGDDFNVWDTEQCVVERGADGAWQIVPGAATTNETLLNGERITAPAPLHEGDVVSVGRAEKGISRLPLTVRAA